MCGGSCRWLGVGKFYIMDNNSSIPAMMVLWDYIKSGVVDYQYFVGTCLSDGQLDLRIQCLHAL